MSFRRLFSLMLLFVLVMTGAVLPTAVVRAQAGAVAGTLPIDAAFLLADPARPRLYAAVPESNSVSVINTTTLAVAATVFTGSGPSSMVLSPDGGTLYVLNTGSTVSAIGVLDLNTLQARPGLSLPGTPISIAAGANGRVYAALAGNALGQPPANANALYQIDSATNTIQADLATLDPTLGTRLQASPDGKTLYVGGGGETIRFVDIATPTAALLPGGIGVGLTSYGEFVLSPSGRRFAFTQSYLGNGGAAGTILYDLAGAADEAPLFSTDSFATEHVLFSPDDALFYKLTNHGGTNFTVDSYDPDTLAKLGETPVISPFDAFYGFSTSVFAVDGSGSYFFVGEAREERDYRDNRKPLTVVLKTGRGTLQPSTPPPSVTVSAAAKAVSYKAREDGTFFLERTGDLSQALLVHYQFGGTASNFQDYDVFNAGTRLIKAGHSRGQIHLHVREPFTSTAVTSVKITLSADPFYTVGKPKKAHIEIDQ